MHTVTLKQIIVRRPCETGMDKLLKGLKVTNKKYLINILQEYLYATIAVYENLYFDNLTEEELNKPIALKFILENNGIRDALWCLQFFKKSKEYGYFKKGMIEIFKPKYEAKHTPLTFKECYLSYTVGNMYVKMADLLIAEGSDDEDFETQVTELFIKHFCQEEE